LPLNYFTFCSGKAILAFVFPIKSNFSKIDENIADAPYGVNRKAPGTGGSWQPAAGRKCYAKGLDLGCWLWHFVGSFSRIAKLRISLVKK
jgi:hypothetical protein